MKGKNLALMAALATGFIIQGASTSYANDQFDAYIDEFMWYEEERDNPEINPDSIYKKKEYKQNYEENLENTNIANDKSEYTVKDLQNLEAEVNSLDQEYDKLQEDIKALEKEAVVEVSESEIAEAKAQWDKGSVEFFEANGSYEAIEVFKSIPNKNGMNYEPSTAPKYLELNRIGNKIDENDSRSLENMKISIESLEAINEKRQKEGGIDVKSLAVFGISDYDMAVAQANANYSSQYIEHSSVYGPSYENLAWSYSDPTTKEAIRQWWDEEKPVFDYLRSLGLKSRNEMEAYIDRNKADMERRFKNPQVGHYTNLVDDLMWGYSWSPKDTISAGYALRKTGKYPYTKSIVMNPSDPTNRTVYSIDDYEDRFLTYYNDLYSVVHLAKKILNEEAFVNMAKLIKKSNKLEGEIKSKKASLEKVRKKQATYIKLQETIEKNRITTAGAKFLLKNSPKEIAHVRPQLLQLIKESEAICRQAENVLRKAGML
ncbi:hypothetical protein [uncultured Anaerococcus sp.]|uniref:hypothetical protein n=1 Tax=uncultured Anaerococcus sp. TaxID=293428 RepID=UPI002623A8B7|nr:hypothetical protein [uncultured Anaerococcus sp.]